jgi:NADPH:quinone reductase-like Zn-dependent oxidoreductase
MPHNLDYEEAASICEGAHYAMNCLKEIDFNKKKNILINGATGAIGSAAVQLAKYYGSKVTAVCNTKNVDLIKSLGADTIIDYQKEDFTLCGQKFDVVLDAVGKSTYFKCKKIMNSDGVYFSTEFGPYYQNIFLPLTTKLFSSQKIKFPLPKHSKQEILFFKLIIESGKYKPVIDRAYHLEEIRDAYRYVETGEKTGAVVVTIGH